MRNIAKNEGAMVTENKDKYYTMVVFVPDLANKIKEDDEELGGGNTAAPVFKSIVSEIVQNND